MKFVSTLLLASSLGTALAFDASANLRVGDESRQLSSSSSTSSSSSSPISGGTWMWYLMLNALNAGIDGFGQGCNKECELPSCTTNHHRELEESAGDDQWANDGHSAEKTDDEPSDGDSSSATTSASNGGSSSSTQPPVCPVRCCAPHVPKIVPKPKPKSPAPAPAPSPSKNTPPSPTPNGKVVHWGDDGHWANDGHSQWSDDGNCWYDDGAWYDDQWANDGYYYWDDDGHNSQAHWLKYNKGQTQSSKNKILFPLLAVGLVVGAVVVALVARRVSCYIMFHYSFRCTLFRYFVCSFTSSFDFLSILLYYSE